MVQGCRDLLRGILEKCQGIKEDENVSVMPDIDTPVNVSISGILMANQVWMYIHVLDADSDSQNIQ